MTKPKLAVLVGSYFAVAFLGYKASSLSKIGPAPMSVSSYGNTVSAEGSWKKVGGHDMVTPQPNVVKIQCEIDESQCTMDEVIPVEIIAGFRHLRVLETVKYRIISWEDGILVAQALNTYGTAFTDHDISLRISVKDKAVTRTWHGKRLKLLGKEVDLSGEWLEESLQF